MGRPKQTTEPCIICKLPQPPIGKYHEFPWHLTCDDDEAGQRKADQWKREQKKIAQAEVPTLI